MTARATLTFAEQLKDPRAHFATPDGILRTADLTRDERLKLLRRWEEDERALVRAGSESPMTGGEQTMLDDVQKAIRRLEADVSGS
ncbi:hypothetical protein [Roseibium aggregatum]|uniref:Uncharacterized protein n=1 Tax=Roseibium aggregatum TaxID=187304 RepID=A0A926S7E0_9HYPH|nr:hypothetical protein [Roseibium aggregatum]MBD1549548.1 hypothetical protein [Roseibium aggregatum]